MALRGRGRIALTGSIAGVRGLPYSPAYCATKAAVHLYADSLRGNLRRKGVGVSLIVPGFVHTPLNEKLVAFMPFAMSDVKAARVLARGLDRGRDVIAFPRLLYWAARLSVFLPPRLARRDPRAIRGRHAGHARAGSPVSAIPGFVTIAAAVWCGASLGVLAITVGLALARPLLIRHRPRNSRREPVTVIIPVKNLDAGFAEAQASVLRAVPDGSEIIVTARDDRSPAVEVARTVYADAAVPVRFLRSTATFAASPKINNLVEAVDSARHDLIFMKDSNIELPPDGVASAIEAFGDDVGLVCPIPRAVDARSFAASVEAQVMNQSHGRLLLAADALGIGFGIGKIMVFRRSALARVGGLAGAAGHSVGEDSALTEAFARIGLRTAFMRTLVSQRLGSRTWKDVSDRQMRWTAVRASNTKLAFAVEPLSFCVVAALAAALAAPLVGLSPLAGAGLCLALWFALETALALAHGWEVSVSAPAVMVARDSLMLAVWMRAWFTRRVVWAGDRMPVGSRAASARPATTDKSDARPNGRTPM